MDNEYEGPVTVTSNEGELIELLSDREDLMSTYALFSGGVPDGVPLPFSSEMVRTWDFVHSARALYLYPEVKDVFTYLGVGILSLSAKEHQEEWVREMLGLYEAYGVVQDTSPLGSGKTFMQCLMAQLLGLMVLVICPANVKPVWEVMEPTVPGLIVLSYDEVRSTRKGDGERVLKHGLLRRVDTTTQVTKRTGNVVIVEDRHHVEFFPTQKLKDLCDAGLLVILDEVQGVKNLSIQQAACEKIVWEAMDAPGSLVSLLSGSPFDKADHSVSFVKTLGYVRKEVLVKREKGKGLVYHGLEELLVACRKLNRPMTLSMERASQVKDAASAREMVWKLYKAVIKPKIAGGARAPRIDFTNTITNTLFILPADDLTRYIFAIGELKAALQFDEATGAVSSVDHTTMMTALENMEGAMLPSVAKDALWKLDTIPGSQVIIFCTFISTYESIENLISTHYDVGIVNGRVSKARRQEVIQDFQAGRIRVLVIGLKVGGVGLSLHDRIGGRTRHSYVFHWWEAIAMYQATQRGYRMGTMSDATCTFAHCAQMPCMKMIDALHKKSDVMREVLADKESYKVRLPGEYKYVVRAPGESKETPFDPYKDRN